MRATQASPLRVMGAVARIVGIRVPTGRIRFDVITSGLEFSIVSDDPLVVVSLPERSHKSKIAGENMAAHRTLEPTDQRAKGPRVGPVRHRLARIIGLWIAWKNHDAMEVIGHDDP